ncbi:hypothetical protein [Iningainema tapete]|uniref:Secreted protein n=1 Tax=Iningainema tapete BLCC-T55 TaxID=2748662 RepID=A0A8J7C9G4_9CYAN|nr:hypothetical protein [Iningainema tapete]MBD2778079.1 hypothetical protein [Iningainema tapete BLCC-T55]
MSKKFVLALLSSPALFASVLSVVMTTQPAMANQTVIPGNGVNCVPNPHAANKKLVCVRVSKTTTVTPKPKVTTPQSESNRVPELQFTEEESDTAIAMFGCDCPSCLNAIRQMRGQAPMPV